jgi:tripartite ATP-independent transporter DctP family solute receptor
MKHNSKIVVITIIVMGLMFIGKAADCATQLKFNHIFAPESLEDRSVKFFASNVEKKSNGSIKVDVFPASQLGDIQPSFQNLTLGVIDLFLVDISLVGYLKGHEDFFIGQVPYLFNSVEDARRIYNSEVFAPVYEKLRKEKGIRVLAVRGDRSPRVINTTKGPIFELSDCKGIKIRVLPNELSIRTFELWGFKPTPVNWAELFMALKQGLVDGQDNGLDVTVPGKFYEVANYYAYSNHVQSLFGWYVSEKTWNKIPENIQKILSEEAMNAGDMLTQLRTKQEQDDLNTILKAGLKITIPNRFAFREATKNLYKEFEGKYWPEGMVEKIRLMQKE